MKILITGNMGYIGPAVVQQLAQSYPEATLIGYDLGLFGANLTNSDILPECRVHMQYFGDVRQISPDILSDIDAVVHLAAVSNDPIANKHTDITMEINYRASERLAILAKESGVRTFVFASSCSVYGFSEGDFTTEQSPVNPLTPYAKSKLLAETALKRLAGKNFQVTCLRFATACGMSERLRLDLVLNDFVAGAMVLKKITVLSNGTPWRALINIKDMARAVDWAVSRTISEGGEYLIVNIGADEWNYQIKELANSVAQFFSDVEVSVNKHALPDRRSYKVNFGLFKTLAPGFQPQYNLLTTILNLKDGLKAMGFNDQHLKSSHLIRLKFLEHLKKKRLINDQLHWIVNSFS